MDREDWWATVHRVTNSRTGLKQLSMHACKKPLPGHVNSLEPKEEILPTTPPPPKRRVGSQSHLPCPSQYSQHNRSSWPLDLESGCCSIKTFNKMFLKETTRG